MARLVPTGVEAHMAKNPIIDVIRRAFAAYETQDRELIESVIAEDFRFTSPQDDHIDRAEYFRRCWPNSGQFRSITVEKIFARAEDSGGDQAFVQYVGETVDGKRFRNVEWHCMKNGKLVEVEVYFGRTLEEGR
jgi:ketosteroid isomerase-like protein